MKFIKTKEEKSVEEIINSMGKKPIEEKKLEHFSREFQPDILKITSVLVSSENDTHIKVSERMFELLKRKWDGVLTTSATLTILFKEEERRFKVLVSNTIERIKVSQRETNNHEFFLIDMSKIGID